MGRLALREDEIDVFRRRLCDVATRRFADVWLRAYRSRRTDPSSNAVVNGFAGNGTWPPPFGRALWCEKDNGELHGQQMLWYRQGHMLVSANVRGGQLHGRLLQRSRLGWRRHEAH